MSSAVSDNQNADTERNTRKAVPLEIQAPRPSRRSSRNRPPTKARKNLLGSSNPPYCQRIPHGDVPNPKSEIDLRSKSQGDTITFIPLHPTPPNTTMTREQGAGGGGMTRLSHLLLAAESDDSLDLDHRRPIRLCFGIFQRPKDRRGISTILHVLCVPAVGLIPTQRRRGKSINTSALNLRQKSPLFLVSCFSA